MACGEIAGVVAESGGAGVRSAGIFRCTSAEGVLTDADEDELSRTAVLLCKCIEEEKVLGALPKMDPLQRLGRVTWGNKPGKARPRYANKVFKVSPSSSIRFAAPKHAHLGKPPSQRTLGIGVDALVKDGHFSVPKILFVNEAIDAKNKYLAECYTNISMILKVKQVAILFSMMKGEQDLISQKAVKTAVAEIRYLSKRLRREVLELGGAPLKEPVSYWRENYRLVKF